MKKTILLILIAQFILQTLTSANNILGQQIDKPLENRAILNASTNDENLEEVSLQHSIEIEMYQSGVMLERKEFNRNSKTNSVINLLLIGEIFAAFSIFLLLAFEYFRSYRPYVPSHEISSFRDALLWK